MKTKIFNNLVELNKYYNKETNTYIFKEGEDWFNVEIQFCFEIESNIKARDIKARDIKAWDIKAWDINACDIKACDINARDIKARDIVFWAICIATKTLTCKSITGERNNAKYLCLDSEPIIE